MSFKQDNLGISNLNQSQAKSRIMDADFARDQIELVKLAIRQNTGIAALTQSISNYDLILQLL